MVTSSYFKKMCRQLGGFIALLMMVTFSSAAEVEALLDRDSVAAGNGAILSLKITGGQAGRPEIPAVENLIVNPRGQNQQIQIVNGDTKVTLVYTYVVGANTPGDYVIPSIEVNVAGEKHTTRPLHLKVVEDASEERATAPPAAQGSAAGGETEVDEGEKRFGFLTVELANPERKHAYVGEIAPVRIRAWLPGGSQAQLRSGIQPEAKGFTLHHVSERPQQSEEMRDGKTYTVVTWFGGISATKAGKLPASLSVDATVAVRDTSAQKPQRRRRSGPFADPFFDDAFDRMNTPMIQKDVTLKSEDQEIEVRPLPTEGRPEGFTGAVGEFAFDQVQIPQSWKTGEPQQVAARLSGSGNFALMKAPVLTPTDSWKIYEGKEKFTAGDDASFSGNKVFQFNAVPRKSGETEAALAFSYFDPAAGKYQTITSAVTKIQVTGKDIVEDQAVAAAPEAKAPEKKNMGIVGQHLKLKPANSLVPLVSRPVMDILIVLNSMMIVAGSVLAMLRRHRENPERRAKAALEKATREALAAAGAARDVEGFFSAARLAIQQRLGLLWNQPPQAITTAEVNGRISEDSPVVRFFREADRYEYSRQHSGEVLPQWRALLAEALASLTPNAR
jgi:hypothetical protein